jgi:hypothetical protein
MGILPNYQILARKARNTVYAAQKGLVTGGNILKKVSDVGDRVLNSVVSADPLLAATPVYGIAKAAVSAAGTAGKIATTVGSIKAPDHVGPAITSLRDAYKGQQPAVGSPPGPGNERVVDHPVPSPSTAADADVTF